MARSYTPFSTTAKQSRGFFDGRRVNVIRQTVQPTTGSALATLGINLPVNAKILWARITSQTTCAVTGGVNTYTVLGGIALIAQPTTASQAVTAALSTASQTFPAFASATSAMMIAVLPSTASAQTNRSTPLTENYKEFATNINVASNAYTVPALLGLVPYLGSGTNSYGIQIKTGGTNSGAVFGTTTSTDTNTVGSLNVEIYFDDFLEY